MRIWLAVMVAGAGIALGAGLGTVKRAVMTDTNGLVTDPVGFWDTNAATISMAVTNGGVTTTTATNIAAYQAFLATNGWTGSGISEATGTNIAAYQALLATNLLGAQVAGLANNRMAAGTILYSNSVFSDWTGLSYVGFTPTLVGGAIHFPTNGAGDYTQYLYVTNPVVTDNNWEIEVKYQTATAIGSGLSVGRISGGSSFVQNVFGQYYNFGPALYIKNSAGTNVFGNTLKSQICAEFTNSVAGDVFVERFGVVGGIAYFYAQNVTRGYYGTVFYSDLSGASPAADGVVANVGRFCIWNNNANGTVDIQSIKVTSFTPRDPALLVIGDSKVLYSPGRQPTYSEILTRRLQKNVVTYSGPGDTTLELLKSIDYVTNSIKPTRVLLSIGCNDLRASVPAATWQSNYTYIVTALTNSGADVTHILPIHEASGLDQSSLEAWIVGQYGKTNCIDARFFDDLMLCADSVHPNGAGHKYIADCILSSGKLGQLVSAFPYSVAADAITTEVNVFTKSNYFGGRTRFGTNVQFDVGPTFTNPVFEGSITYPIANGIMGVNGTSNQVKLTIGAGLSYDAPTTTLSASGGTGLAIDNISTRSNLTTLTETPIYTNSHTLSGSNNLSMNTTIQVEGPTNHLFQQWDVYFRNGAFNYSNTISQARSGTWMEAHWKTNSDWKAVLYLKCGLTNEDSKVHVKATEVWSTNGVVAGGGGWSYNAVLFDGNDYFTATNGLSGAADTQRMTVSFWFKMPTNGIAASVPLVGDSAGHLDVFFNASTDKMTFEGYNASGTKVLSLNSGTITRGAWHHIICSWKLDGTAIGDIWVDGAQSYDPVLGTTGETVDAAGNDFYVGMDHGNTKFIGDVCELYVHYGSYIALDATEVAKWRTSGGKPENLGADGSTPMSGQPELYLHGDYTAWGTNSGSGGNLSATGAVENTTAP